MPPATAGRAATQARQHLLDVLGPVVSDAGFDLEDVSVSIAGRRSLIRVLVDRDGGIDLDAVAQVSRAISEVLDADEPDGGAFAGPYVLEVSSPGVDRPLTEQRHWRRAVGRLVQTEVGGSPVTGRVLETTDAGVRLDVDSSARDVLWAELGEGRVQVEFTRPGDHHDPDDDHGDSEDPDDDIADDVEEED